jgi:hypothetical protein
MNHCLLAKGGEKRRDRSISIAVAHEEARRERDDESKR